MENGKNTHESLAQRLDGFIHGLDRYTQDESHPDYAFNLDTWDHLVELQYLASRVVRPSESILQSLAALKALVLDNSVRQSPKNISGRLQRFEEKYQELLRPKTDKDVV